MNCGLKENYGVEEREGNTHFVQDVGSLSVRHFSEGSVLLGCPDPSQEGLVPFNFKARGEIFSQSRNLDGPLDRV